MDDQGLIFGLLSVPQGCSDEYVAHKCRELTICWSRYSYHGPIIEGVSIDAILEQAADCDARYCFVQSSGQIIWESWNPLSDHDGNFCTALKRWADERELLVAGRLVGDTQDWYGLEDGFLLVDLETYRKLGRPQYDSLERGPVEVPTAIAVRDAQGLASLSPTGEREVRKPREHGWGFVAASLATGLAVPRLDLDLLNRTICLSTQSSTALTQFASYFGSGIESFVESEAASKLSAGQAKLLAAVAEQATTTERGVGLWNIESYADVEIPLNLEGPVSSLYAVAQGFKSNRILDCQGFDRYTRVVLFDYSHRALEVKRRMIELWNGEDFPRFVKYLFQILPHPETYYCLWADVTPDTVDDGQLQAMWETELDKWGGAAVFRAHWQRFRQLRHTFVCTNILTEPEAILAFVRPEPNAAIWWSNAFFTFYSNWHYSIDQRRQMYERWIAGLVERNPVLHLYGSDYENSSVNLLQAQAYWKGYCERPAGPLLPRRLHELQIRM